MSRFATIFPKKAVCKFARKFRCPGWGECTMDLWQWLVWQVLANGCGKKTDLSLLTIKKRNQGWLADHFWVVGWAMAIQIRNFIHSASANCPKPFATSPWERTMLLLSRWIWKSMFGAKLRYLEKCNMYLISKWGPKAWLDLAKTGICILGWFEYEKNISFFSIRFIHLGTTNLQYTIFFFPMNTRILDAGTVEADFGTLF